MITATTQDFQHSEQPRFQCKFIHCNLLILLLCQHGLSFLFAPHSHALRVTLANCPLATAKQRKISLGRKRFALDRNLSQIVTVSLWTVWTQVNLLLASVFSC